MSEVYFVPSVIMTNADLQAAIDSYLKYYAETNGMPHEEDDTPEGVVFGSFTELIKEQVKRATATIPTNLSTL